MKTKKVFTLFATLVVIVALVGVVPAAAAPGSAPIYRADAATAIPGRYIVVFKAGTSAADVSTAVANMSTAEQARGSSGQVDFVYGTALNGFAASLSDQALSDLSQNPNVEFIEADQVVTLSATQSPATWGLDRIDQRKLPLNNKYKYNFTGDGVLAFIIDSGIRVTHNEFGGRAFSGYDYVDNDSNADDCNGHGTHVAGTIGGKLYGVAKRVTLIAFRVFDCAGGGTLSAILAAVDDITFVHTTEKAVANMSLEVLGAPSPALDNAVRNSIADGIVYVIAAGNSNSNACQVSPARVGEAITVGATTMTDARASFSNKGRCLDLFAPGEFITSAWFTSNTATNTISGTSMAAPHVAGVAALYLQGHNATPQQVRNAIVGAATAGVVKNRGDGSPNLLLFSLIGGDDD